MFIIRENLKTLAVRAEFHGQCIRINRWKNDLPTVTQINQFAEQNGYGIIARIEGGIVEINVNELHYTRPGRISQQEMATQLFGFLKQTLPVKQVHPEAETATYTPPTRNREAERAVLRRIYAKSAQPFKQADESVAHSPVLERIFKARRDAAAALATSTLAVA